MNVVTAAEEKETAKASARSLSYMAAMVAGETFMMAAKAGRRR